MASDKQAAAKYGIYLSIANKFWYISHSIDKATGENHE